MALPRQPYTDHRIVMALISVALVVTKLIRLNPLPSDLDPWGPRLFVIALALGVLIATYVSERARRSSYLLCQGVGHALFIWAIFTAYQNTAHIEASVGIIPAALITPMFVRSTRELILALTVNVAGFLALFFGGSVLAFPLHILAFLTLVLTFTLGSLSRGRAVLEEQLLSLNQQLESRVEERTHALAASLRRVEAESEERAKAERSALRASRAKSVFLANMSHELRTPLNAIVGYTEMVTEELIDDRADLVADLDHVHASATHLLGLIDGVLDLSRVEAEELDLRIEPISIAAAVDDALLLLPTGNHTSVKIEKELDDVQVMADGSRLRQVILNLLSNAQKFTESGTITIRSTASKGRVLLQITDTGIGIEPASLPYIFDRFVQAQPCSAGTGLGLAVCRMLIDQMGGQITAESIPSQGSTFSVSLASA